MQIFFLALHDKHLKRSRPKINKPHEFNRQTTDHTPPRSVSAHLVPGCCACASPHMTFTGLSQLPLTAGICPTPFWPAHTVCSFPPRIGKMPDKHFSTDVIQAVAPLWLSNLLSLFQVQINGIFREYETPSQVWVSSCQLCFRTPVPFPGN